MGETKPLVAVLLVQRGEEVLLLRRGPTAPWKPGWWNLPGGEVEPNEFPAEAALREGREEAGVQHVLGGPCFVGCKGGLWAFWVRVPETFAPILCSESDAFMWVKATDPLPEPLVEPLAEVFDWLRGLG